MKTTSDRPDILDGADVVLVGAGHAHLLVALQARRFHAAGLGLALVDPGDFWYSGMATGVLGGRYRAEEDKIDVASFAEARGVRLVRDRVTGMDRTAQRLVLASGRHLPYRIASFNIGSDVGVPFPVKEQDGLWRAKPIHRLPELRERLLSEARSRRRVRILVIGGGSTGCELACNLAAIDHAAEGRLEITLVQGGPRLLPRDAEAVSRTMHHFLVKRRVTVRLGVRMASLQAGHARLEDGGGLDFDHAVLATGLVANRDIGKLGLAADEERGLRVDGRLRSVDDPHVFAAGDCADMRRHPLPRLGVFGVRAAPVLADNLLAQLRGSELREYRPQRIWFSALNLGDGTGLATWGRLWWRGHAALRAKEFFDRRFMARLSETDRCRRSAAKRGRIKSR